MHDPYSGNDLILAANVLGMNIARVGNSIIPIHTFYLTLNNVLHVPSSQKPYVCSSVNS
jgi:hypothetical protein